MPEQPDLPEVPEPIWVGFGLDPISEKLVVIGFTPNKDGALAEAKNHPELCYLRTFMVWSPTFGQDLYDWFLSCGLTTTDATDLVRKYGASVLEMIAD